MMRCVTKATPIQFISGKCHIKKHKGCKTALSSYYACFSCNLLLMSSGVDTRTHTPMFMDKMISRSQVCGPAAHGHLV